MIFIFNTTQVSRTIWKWMRLILALLRLKLSRLPHKTLELRLGSNLRRRQREELLWMELLM